MFERFSWNEIQTVVLTRGMRVVFILLASFIIYRLVALGVRRVKKAIEDEDPTTQSDAEKRAETLGRIVQQSVFVILFIVTTMVIMRELGFDLGPMIAGAGIVGLAIGFGAQHLVKDVITGFFILLENQYRVGDTVELGGKSGVVEAVNLRTTVLRDNEGRVHVVPNGSITVVTNTTKGWGRVVVDVGVAYSENIDRVMDVLREIGREMEQDEAWKPRILDSLEIGGVQNLGGYSVDIRVAMRVRPDDRLPVGRELRRRIKNRFDELGIAYPHMNLIPPVGLPPAPPPPSEPAGTSR